MDFANHKNEENLRDTTLENEAFHEFAKNSQNPKFYSLG